MAFNCGRIGTFVYILVGLYFGLSLSGVLSVYCTDDIDWKFDTCI